MLEDVVQNDIVERQKVIDFNLAESVLGGRQVAEGMWDEDAAMIQLGAVEKTADRRLNTRLQGGPVWGVVRRPPAHLQRQPNNKSSANADQTAWL